jgi:hypothetical protein
MLTWEDSIKMDVKGTGYEDVDWINWIQDRGKRLVVINMVMSLVFRKTQEPLFQLRDY